MKKIYFKPIGYILGLIALPCIAEAQTTTLTYSFTGSIQNFTVPACVTSLTLDVRGSKGGDCIYNQPGTKPDDLGGLGGRVVAVYSVTPGQVLNIFVGGIPYNGGGTGAGSIAQAGGGGASDIRIGGTAMTDRIIVAGGGGGGGNNCSPNAEPGGNGGGLTGATGWQCNSQTGTAVGQGGTQSAGGAPGTSPATAGSLGQGGNAGGAGTASGGGGGGYYGGGGAAFGGGGGGSSYANPSATSVVHTQGFNNGTGIVTISYGPSPVSITSSSPNVCSGSTATLSAPSLQTYTWSNGATTATAQVSPTVATTYSMQGTDLAGCPVVGMISIGIISTPTISTSATSSSVCAGNSTTLTASGSASSYSWSTGATTASVSVSPTVTTSYTVTGTNACGSTTTTISISVNNGPGISLPASTVVCGGGTVTLIATGSGVTSYSWNTGATTSSISVSPTVTTNYTVSGTGACGTATAMTTVSMGAAPTVTAASSSSTICINSSVVLTATGSSGSTYLWNTGATSASISVSPTTTTVYTVTASNACGTTTTSITQYVSLCTSLKELSDSEIRLYPNPASDLIHVSLPSHLLSRNASIEISDAVGKIVSRESLSRDVSTVKLGQLEHGIYFFKILFNDELFQTGKIIKQ